MEGSVREPDNEMLIGGKRQGFPYGFYFLDGYGDGAVDVNNAVMFYNPTQIQGSLSYMVRPQGCATADDGVYLTSEHCSLPKMSDGYDQDVQELDYSERDIGGVIPFEPYSRGLENFPAPGVPVVQGNIEVPPHTPPLPLRRELVPQARYGDKANSKRGFNREPSITFAVGTQDGMSLQDAMNEKYEGLVGRDDEMFVGWGCTAFSLRVEVCAPLESLRGVSFVHNLLAFLS